MRTLPTPRATADALLTVAAAAALGARAYDYFRTEGAYPALSWEGVVSSGGVAADGPGLWYGGLGVALAAAALASLGLARSPRTWSRRLVLAGAAILCADAALAAEDLRYSWAYLVEYVLPVAAPLALVRFAGGPRRAHPGIARRRAHTTSSVRWGCVAVAVALVAHGLGVAGVLPVPVDLPDVSGATLGIHGSASGGVPPWIGSLGLVLAPLLLHPRTRGLALAGASVWGAAAGLTCGASALDAGGVPPTVAVLAGLPYASYPLALFWYARTLPRWRPAYESGRWPVRRIGMGTAALAIAFL